MNWVAQGIIVGGLDNASKVALGIAMLPLSRQARLTQRGATGWGEGIRYGLLRTTISFVCLTRRVIIGR